MNVVELKDKILDDGSGFTFTLDGNPCGMEPDYKNGKTVYGAWSGDKNKDYTDIDELMIDKFYSGKSMTELLNNNEVELDFI